MLYASFVLPAPNGCNLKCSFCAIAQRGEAKTSKLGHEDYVRFLSDILAHYKVGRVGIQGYEPLLPEAWPLARKLLRLGNLFMCETSLITNGVELEAHASELAEMLDSATVSIDSHASEIHDKLRGVPGTHAKAVTGLKALTKAFGSRKDVTVNSVLFPNRAQYLEGMPELLSAAGVTDWLISPAMNFSKVHHVSNPEFIKETILSLADKAKGYGIEVFLGDELRKLENGTDLLQALSVQALEGDDLFFRLSPDGSCSRGKEALGLAEKAPKWDGLKEPHLFLKDIFEEAGRHLPDRRFQKMAGLWAKRAARTQKKV